MLTHYYWTLSEFWIISVENRLFHLCQLLLHQRF